MRTNVAVRAFPLVLASAVALGGLLRWSIVRRWDWPINDGGLFYRMVQDLQNAGYALPAYSTYNGLGMPFAYPPLAFYLAAGFNDLTGIALSDTFRVLPLALTTLHIAAFALLARALLTSRLAVAIATFAFALLPSAFNWLIMGGGLTRSFGLLFALLAMHQVHAFLTTGRRRNGVAAAVLGALTGLSHVEMAWFLTFSSALLLIVYARRRSAMIGLGAIGAGAIVLAAPWWLTIVARHGVGTFLAAMQTGSLSDNPFGDLILLRPTSEPHFTLIAALAMAGALASLARRQYLLAAWVVACALLDQRAFGTVASVPIALLAGVGAVAVAGPLLRGHVPATGELPAARPPSPWLARIAIGGALCYALWAAIVADTRLLVAIAPEERAAMQWVATNTPRDSRFLVLTTEDWAGDQTAEWFPALADRVSVATVQGWEWFPGRAFARQVIAYETVQDCGYKDADCLAQWSAKRGLTFDHVYLPKTAGTTYPMDVVECCGSLRSELRHDDRYDLVATSSRSCATCPGSSCSRG